MTTQAQANPPSVAQAEAGKPSKVIYDTDPGVDDAMALYYALAHPAIDVVGITTTFGNVTVEQAAINALYLTPLQATTFPSQRA